MHDEHAMALTCLYCDDVRLESEGRSTLVGWYAQDALTHAGPFPITVLNLAVVLLLRVAPMQTVQSLQLELWLDDELRYSVSPTAEDLQAIWADAMKAPGQSDAMTVRVAMKFPNLPIPKPGHLYFKAALDGDVAISNALVIQQV